MNIQIQSLIKTISNSFSDVGFSETLKYKHKSSASKLYIVDNSNRPSLLLTCLPPVDFTARYFSINLKVCQLTSRLSNREMFLKSLIEKNAI